MINLNITDISTIINTLSATSMFFQYFFMFMSMVIAMLPIAKYLVWRKDVADWRTLTLITELGLEEQDLRNQMAQDFVYSCEQLAEMDDIHGHDLNMIHHLEQYAARVLNDRYEEVVQNDRLRTDLERRRAMVEEQAAKINAQSRELAQLKRGSKKPINVMPALTINTIVRPISRDILPAVEDEEYMH